MSDTISRSDAIEQMQTWAVNLINPKMLSREDAIYILESMPSAQPGTARRIVGKSRDGITLWYQCDMCNEPVDAQDNFCSGCGRRLTDE